MLTEHEIYKSDRSFVFQYPKYYCLSATSMFECIIINHILAQAMNQSATT
jgi:hypothetical protein